MCPGCGRSEETCAGLCEERGGFDICDCCGGDGWFDGERTYNHRCTECDGAGIIWHADEMDDAGDDYATAIWSEHSQFGVGA